MDFQEFEHQGWQDVAAHYDQTWALVTTQAVDPLLDAAGVGPHKRVLDVACGPGYVAAAAALRGAEAVGIDFSSVMVEQARSRYPRIVFQEGNAEELDFPDRSFDAVVSNFGMLHLADPERAIAEACRVLRSAGRIAFTVWDTAEHAVGHGIVQRAVQAHGNLNVALPPGPPFFRFSDPAESTRVLSAAGFRDIRITRIDQTWQLPAADSLFEIMYHSSVRNAALLRAQQPWQREAIREAMRREVEARGNVLPMPAVCCSGSR
jgi:ubiquinone/menaquinone biosynthesis C-methylase UbiE